MQAKRKLQPDDIRAIYHLKELLNKSLYNLIIPEITSDIWKKDNFQVFSEPIKVRNIPSGSNWRWNQTKSRKTTFLPQYNAQVSFIKLIPRKIVNNINDSPIPNLKIWSFIVTFTSNNKQPLYILWCEKGSKTIQEETVNEIFQKQNIDIYQSNKLYASKISYICN